MQLHKDQDQQNNHELAMDSNNMTMNFKWIKKNSQMAITMVYNVCNTTTMKFFRNHN
jgi:hypothetical protein